MDADVLYDVKSHVHVPSLKMITENYGMGSIAVCGTLGVLVVSDLSHGKLHVHAIPKTAKEWLALDGIPYKYTLPFDFTFWGPGHYQALAFSSGQRHPPVLFVGNSCPEGGVPAFDVVSRSRVGYAIGPGTAVGPHNFPNSSRTLCVDAMGDFVAVMYDHTVLVLQGVDTWQRVKVIHMPNTQSPGDCGVNFFTNGTTIQLLVSQWCLVKENQHHMYHFDPNPRRGYFVFDRKISCEKDIITRRSRYGPWLLSTLHSQTVTTVDPQSGMLGPSLEVGWPIWCCAEMPGPALVVMGSRELQVYASVESMRMGAMSDAQVAWMAAVIKAGFF